MRRNLNLRYQPVTPSSVKNETKNIFYLARATGWHFEIIETVFPNCGKLRNWDGIVRTCKHLFANHN